MNEMEVRRLIIDLFNMKEGFLGYNPPKGVYRMSSLGFSCPRYIHYYLNGYQRHRTLWDIQKGDIGSVAMLGTIMHEKIQKEAVKRLNASIEVPLSFEIEKGLKVVGHVDMLIDGVPVEIKTVADCKRYTKPSKSHTRQVQLQLHGLDADHGFIAVICRRCLDVSVYRIERDSTFVQLLPMLKREKPDAKPNMNRSECRICPYFSTCMQEVYGE